MTRHHANCDDSEMFLKSGDESDFPPTAAVDSLAESLLLLKNATKVEAGSVGPVRIRMAPVFP